MKVLIIIDQRVNEKFEPERFEDEVRSRMMERIQHKIAGQEISTPPEEAAESKIAAPTDRHVEQTRR